MSLDARSREYREYVEAYLKDFYAQFHDAPQKDLYKAMEYSLLGGGKRLRPIFAFEFCRLCGRDWKDAAPFAAAVEMIHTYSLIHDDLPCMDDDDLRRGQPTTHKKFGETLAVLAGDALQPEAFRLIAEAPSMSDGSRVEAVRVLAEGMTNRVICVRDDQIVNVDIDEGLAMKKTLNAEEFEVMTVMTGV